MRFVGLQVGAGRATQHLLSLAHEAVASEIGSTEIVRVRSGVVGRRVTLAASGDERREKKGEGEGDRTACAHRSRMRDERVDENGIGEFTGFRGRWGGPKKRLLISKGIFNIEEPRWSGPSYRRT
jgi:hypothetical protein